MPTIEARKPICYGFRMTMSDANVTVENAQASKYTRGVLVVVTSAQTYRVGDRFVLDDKALSGFYLYQKFWGGPIRAIFRESSGPVQPFSRAIDITSLPFKIIVLPETAEISVAELVGADVVLAVGDNHLDFPVAELCQTMGIPMAFAIENIPVTRHQISLLSDAAPWRKFKSLAWTVLSERKRLKAFDRATALQANGTPATRHYSRVNNNILTYFDTRLSDAQQVTTSERDARKARLLSQAPLRLAFSGRLERLKGADHLVPVARQLLKKGVDFHLDIFGPGSLEQSMRDAVAAAALADHVTFHGPVDFDDTLVPWMKAHADIFLCCHRQSDPSCTYLETLGCGVPIMGYDNLAFSGLLGLADVGWKVPIGNVDAIVDCLYRLNSKRAEICTKSDAAADFSADHSFEKTFSMRVEHLRSIVAEDRG